MAINWYQCKKCETLIKQDASPKSSGCPQGSFHDWNKLGELGTKIICVKNAELIFKQTHLLKVLVVQIVLFTTGKNSNLWTTILRFI